MVRTHGILAAFACASLSVCGVGSSSPAFAQDTPAAQQDQPAAGTPASDQSAPDKSGPDKSGPDKSGSDQAGKAPQPVAATDPNLTVATVRLEGGYRASKVIGAAVYNDQNQQVGTVDDIILNHDNKADLIVISVGGFLGVGGKLVAMPYGKIERTDSAKVMLPDASKDMLAKLPSFTYAQ